MSHQKINEIVIGYFKGKLVLTKSEEHDIPSVNYLDNGNMDSLMIVEMITFFETEFNMQFSYQDLTSNEFKTIGGLINIIISKI